MTTLRIVLGSVLAAVLITASVPNAPAQTPSEKEAFDLGVEAYIYGYPLVTMEMTRRVMTNVAARRHLEAVSGEGGRPVRRASRPDNTGACSSR